MIRPPRSSPLSPSPPLSGSGRGRAPAGERVAAGVRVDLLLPQQGGRPPRLREAHGDLVRVVRRIERDLVAGLRRDDAREGGDGEDDRGAQDLHDAGRAATGGGPRGRPPRVVPPTASWPEPAWPAWRPAPSPARPPWPPAARSCRSRCTSTSARPSASR